MNRAALTFLSCLILATTSYGQGIIFPVDNYQVTGYSFAQQTPNGRHLGEDVMKEPGTPVRATADGTIVYSRKDRPGYGQYVVIAHPSPVEFVSVYGHLSKQPQWPLRGAGPVKKGEIIGYVGSDDENGLGGPHLHFAIYKKAHDGQYRYWGYAPNDTGDDVDFDAQGNSVGGFFTKASAFVNTYAGQTSGGPLAWEFNTAGNFEGWRAINISAPGTGASVRDGKLFMDPIGSDPQIISPALSVNASSYRYVQISLASNAIDPYGNVYFKVQGDAGFSAEKRVEFRVQNCALCGSAPFVYYSIDMRQDPDWVGTIVGIRIDPANDGKANTNTDSVAFDYVRLSP